MFTHTHTPAFTDALTLSDQLVKCIWLLVTIYPPPPVEGNFFYNTAKSRVKTYLFFSELTFHQSKMKGNILVLQN